MQSGHGATEVIEEGQLPGPSEARGGGVEAVARVLQAGVARFQLDEVPGSIAPLDEPGTGAVPALELVDRPQVRTSWDQRLRGDEQVLLGDQSHVSHCRALHQDHDQTPPCPAEGEWEAYIPATASV